MKQKIIKELIIDLPHKISTNAYYSGMHWAKRNKIAKDFHYAVKYALNNQLDKIGFITKYPIKVGYKFYLKGKLLDVLNLSAMAKMLEDGLRYCGTLVDDGPKYISAVILEEWKLVDKNIKNNRVKIVFYVD